jgi:hypothetical protein
MEKNNKGYGQIKAEGEIYLYDNFWVKVKEIILKSFRKRQIAKKGGR